MTDHPALDELIRSADPVPNPAAPPAGSWTSDVALLEIERRRAQSQTQQPTTGRVRARPTFQRRNALVAVAPFAVALVVVGVAVLVLRSDNALPPTATTTAPTTTTALPAETTTTVPALSRAEAAAIVDSVFAAFNSGDMDTWALWREGGQGTGSDFAYELAAGARIDVEQCTYRGFGIWLMDSPMTGHGFDCRVTATDRILEAAGIELEMTYNWVIGADPESSRGSNEDSSVVDWFMAEFHEWLAATHPDVEASIQYVDEDDQYVDGDDLTPESVPILLEYIDEFVAQSDRYPLTEPVPERLHGGLLIEVCEDWPRANCLYGLP